MRRWLTLPIAILSLLLCLASTGMWIRSHFFRDLWIYAKPGGNQHLFQSLLGNLHILSDLDGRSSGGNFYTEDRLVPDAIWNGGMSGYPPKVNKHFGFVFQNYARTHFNNFSGFGGSSAFTTHHRLIVIPWWFPTLLFAIFPTLWLRSFLRHRFRKIIGHCPKCNYDLRATPNRCPECGWTHSSQLVTSSSPPSMPSGPKE